MADAIKDYDTDELIEYLKRKDLKLSNKHVEIFQQEEIDGLSFSKLTEEKLRTIGFSFGPAIKLAEFVSYINEQKLRPFSSYKTVDELKELLHEYKVKGDNITCIK